MKGNYSAGGRYAAGVGAPPVRLDREFHQLVKRMQEETRADGVEKIQIVIFKPDGQRVEITESFAA